MFGAPKSVSFSAEQAEWIEQQADERDRSHAEIVRRAIDFACTSDASLTDDAPNTTTHQLTDRVNELENVVGEIAERVEGIERSLPDNSEPRHQVTDEDVETDGALETATDAPIDDVLDNWRPGRSIDEREARRESGRAAIEWLREVETASAGEFKREAYPEIGLETQSADTWWRKTA